MSELDAEEAGKWVDVGDKAFDLAARVVGVLGPWPTAFVLVGLIVGALVAYQIWSNQKDKEQAAANRGYESSIEAMSSEIRILRMKLLLKEGYSIDDASRILDLSAGHHQPDSAQPSQAPTSAVPLALPPPPARGAASSSAPPHRPKTRRGKP